MDKSEEIKVKKVTETEFREKKKGITVVEAASVETKNALMFFKWWLANIDPAQIA